MSLRTRLKTATAAIRKARGYDASWVQWAAHRAVPVPKGEWWRTCRVSGRRLWTPSKRPGRIFIRQLTPPSGHGAGRARHAAPRLRNPERSSECARVSRKEQLVGVHFFRGSRVLGRTAYSRSLECDG